jgi:hypothetical protein
MIKIDTTPIRICYHAKLRRNEQRVSARPSSAAARTLVRFRPAAAEATETSTAGQPRRRPQTVRRVRPPAGVRTVRILSTAKAAVVIYRAQPVDPAETAGVVAADLPGHRGHAGEAVGQAAVDVILFTDRRHSFAVVDVRQIGLKINYISKTILAILSKVIFVI